MERASQERKVRGRGPIAREILCVLERGWEDLKVSQKGHMKLECRDGDSLTLILKNHSECYVERGGRVAKILGRMPWGRPCRGWPIAMEIEGSRETWDPDLKNKTNSLGMGRVRGKSESRVIHTFWTWPAGWWWHHIFRKDMEPHTYHLRSSTFPLNDQILIVWVQKSSVTTITLQL